jgi:DNA polymerase (family 10)
MELRNDLPHGIGKKKMHLLDGRVSDLPDAAQLWLKHNPLTKIPRAYADKICALLCIDKNGAHDRLVICGSYRRQKEILGDIDILTTMDLKKVLDSIKKHGDVAIISQGEERVELLLNCARWPGLMQPHWIKVDIFHAAPGEWIPYLLYLTGSKRFNMIMRRNAKDKGYLLNQRGLFKKDKKVKISTEADMLEILGMNMKYLDPKLRDIA